MIKKFMFIFGLVLMLYGCIPTEDPIFYTVTFIDVNGNVIKIEEVEYGTFATPPVAPPREGYNFISWDISFDVVTQNITVKPIYEHHIYEIDFSVGIGDSIPKMQIKYGEKLEMINMEKAGYHFDGWYLDSEFNHLFNFEQAITNAITLYAKWEINQYTVHYEGLDEPYQVVLDYHEIPEPPLTPTKEGHEFNGWFFDDEFNRPYTPMPIDENLHLYAKWNPILLTINFESMVDDIEIEAQTISYGETLETPEVPQRPYYQFDGWFLDSKYETSYDFEKITGSMTLYASWSVIPGLESYPVYFQDTNFEAITVKTNTNPIEPDTPTKEGYHFIGWYKDSDYNEEYLFSNEIITTVTNIYAKWEINQYSVQFFNVGDIQPINVEYNALVSLPIPEPREGYTFQGWFFDQDLKTPFNNQTVKADLSLYGSWTINEYMVIFMGSENIGSQQVKYNQFATTPLNPLRVGHRFIGWYTSDDYNQLFNFWQPIKQTTFVYSKWEINRYTISFSSNGGSYIQPISSDYAVYVNEPSAPTRQGYDFIGWFKDQNFEQRFYFGNMPAENISLYAKWQIKSYTITYHSNSGSVFSPTVYTYGSTLELPIPTLSGHTFIGWFKDIELLNQFSDQVMPADNLNLYAKWEETKNTISFNSNGGTAVNNITAKPYSSIEQPEHPTQTGYTFLGWFTSIDVAEPYEFTVMPVENLTLIAKWRVNAYTITYDTKSGSAIDPITQNYGTTLQAPTSPTRTGYSFTGWYSDIDLANAYTFSSMPANNLTLYAKWTINQYTISFNSDGGSEVIAITQNYNTNVNAPTTPTRTGYTFLGWFTSMDATEPYEFMVMPVENLTLIAKWEYSIVTTSVTFESNGGSLISTITQDEGTILTAPENPTRTGYTFAGWYSDVDFINTYTFSTMPATNLTLYAKWTINQYTITFNSDGGSEVIAITQNFNSSVETPTAPTRTGYTFLGWFTSMDATQPYEFTTISGQNIELVAKWRVNAYTITYDTKSGSAIDPITQNYGTTLQAPTAPTRTGYTFAGWYSDVDLTNTYTFSTMPATNLTLYAKWTVNAYTISFNSNGGSEVTEMTQNYNTNVNAPTAPTRTGYTFLGWFTSLETSVAYEFTVVPSQNITLYAKWTINQYTITFNSNDGSVVTAITQNFDTAVEAPTAPTRTGYTFAGWFANDLLTVSYTFNTIPAQNITLHAKWTINQYTITFNSNGGSEVTEITQNYNTNVNAPTAPTRTGYTFAGWYSDVDLTNAYTFSTISANNFTLYAKWTINQYTITFNSNGGSEVTAITQNFDTAVEAPTAPTRTGYTFAGWFANDTLTVSYTFNTIPAQNITLYAKWTINQYTITFNSNGGSEVTAITQNFDTAVEAPTAPTRTGYTFAGWYSDVDLINAYTFSTMSANDFTLYAKWTINQYIITFNSNGGSVVTAITQNFDTAVEAPNAPTRTGYTFAGWFANDALTVSYTFNTIPAQNITLYAKWTINQYTITFNSNGGSEVTAITQNYNSSVEAPSAPTRTGYTFAGWHANDTLTISYTFNTMPAQNITLYAKWTINQYTITFNTNQGSSVEAISLDFGSALNAPTAPTRTGYSFGGWFEEDSLITPYVFNTMPAENKTLYAKWTVNAYTITFNSNGGTTVGAITQNYNTSVQAPSAPTRTGYTFLGWFTSIDATEVYEFTTISAQNITLIAKWRINQYTITFESRAGTPINPLTQDFDTDITLSTPTRAGYTFAGWYIDNELTTVFNLERMPAYDIVLFAKWEVN